jgi:hypothetical protein
MYQTRKNQTGKVSRGNSIFLENKSYQQKEFILQSLLVCSIFMIKTLLIFKLNGSGAHVSATLDGLLC